MSEELDQDEIVHLRRPILNAETGENEGWHDFSVPRWVAEKQLNREQKIGAWKGVKYAKKGDTRQLGKKTLEFDGKEWVEKAADKSKEPAK